MEGKRKPTCEHVVSVCLDEAFTDRCVEIGSNLSESLKFELIACLKKNLNTFAWAAEDMPGIDINITCHELNVDPTVKPIKQRDESWDPSALAQSTTKSRNLSKSDPYRKLGILTGSLTQSL